MASYALRRLLLLIPTLLLASVLIFVLMRVVPGDVASAILRDEATPESLAALREELGLNRPVLVQYADWMAGIVRLDLGNSLLYRGHKIGDLVREAFPITLHLTFWGMTITLALALPVGIYSALRQNSMGDYLLRLFVVGGLSVPTFWLGIIVLYLLTIHADWSPRFQYISMCEDPWGSFQAFAIPSAVFAYHTAAIIARMLRSQLLEVIREDYIRTANAKGLRGRVVANRHALPNALLPVVTIVGNQFAVMLSGLVVVERIFALPGLGTLMITGAVNREFNMVQSLFLLIAAMVVVVNLLVDLLYGWLDPRIKLS